MGKLAGGERAGPVVEAAAWLPPPPTLPKHDGEDLDLPPGQWGFTEELLPNFEGNAKKASSVIGDILLMVELRRLLIRSHERIEGLSNRLQSLEEVGLPGCVVYVWG